MRRLIFTTAIFLCTTFLVYGSLPGDPVCAANPAGLLQDNHKLVVSGTSVFDGNRKLTPEEVLIILNPSSAYADQYNRGLSLRSSGVALLVGGGVVMVGGIVLMISGVESYNDINDSETEFANKYFLGLLATGLGELMVDGGIACTVIGKVKIRRSISHFNASGGSSYFAPQTINYRFGLLDNGNIGIKLTF